jgi:hypothetical protein
MYGNPEHELIVRQWMGNLRIVVLNGPVTGTIIIPIDCLPVPDMYNRVLRMKQRRAVLSLESHPNEGC